MARAMTRLFAPASTLLRAVKMKVTAVAAELKKSRVKTPRILMITNDPDQAKVVVKIKVQ